MKKKSRFKSLMEAIMLEMKEHRSTLIVYSVMRLLVIIIAVLQFLNGNYEQVFFCVLTLLLMIVPGFVQVTFKIDLPSTLEIIILIFIFAAEILGEMGNYYIKYPYWDTLLHTTSGFICAGIGFSLVNLLNDDERLQFNLSPLFLVVVAFCFSMTIGVIWEFFEFGIDQILQLDAQKDTIIHAIHSVDLATNGATGHLTNIKEVIVDGQVLPFEGYLDIGLIDTMQDLMVNFVGAFVFCFIGYFSLKYKVKGRIIEKLTLRKSKKE